MEVLQLMCKQMTGAEMAEELFISISTVKYHKTNILVNWFFQEYWSCILYTYKRLDQSITLMWVLFSLRAQMISPSLIVFTVFGDVGYLFVKIVIAPSSSISKVSPTTSKRSSASSPSSSINVMISKSSKSSSKFQAPAYISP